MDLLLTAANAALLVSHDLRRDSEATLVFLGSPDPPRTIRLDGARLQSLSPDLRTNAGLIRKALAHGARLERQTSPGVFASRRGVADVIAEISGPLIHLREDGKDIRGVEIPRDVAFILSDSVELTGEEEAVVAKRRVAVCSVGPMSLHTGDAIAVVQNEMDRRYPT